MTDAGDLCGHCISQKWKAQLTCIEPKGHKGDHRSRTGSTWKNYADPATAGEPRGPKPRSF